MTQHHAFELIGAETALTLVRQWTCRHCGALSPTITEFCNGCGIEDCRQGTGDETARDRALRLTGKRGTTGLWSDEVRHDLINGLVR